MMKILKGGSAVILAAVLVAGCSGGDDDDSSAGLSSGTYTYANATVSPDECQVGDVSSLNGTTSTVTVSGNTVSFTLGSSTIDLTMSGTQLSSTPIVDTIDWTDPVVATSDFGLSQTYNCVEEDTYEFSGTVTGQNAMAVDYSIEYGMSSGQAADCIAANTSAFGLTLTTFPCSSIISFDLAQ